jgi:hypothetical protein
MGFAVEIVFLPRLSLLGEVQTTIEARGIALHPRFQMKRQLADTAAEPQQRTINHSQTRGAPTHEAPDPSRQRLESFSPRGAWPH